MSKQHALDDRIVEVVDVNVARKSPDKRFVTYVGRGTIFGNPWPARDESDRDAVCDQYHEYFIDRFTNDPEFQQAVHGLADQYRQAGYLRLGCHCAPRRCHSDTIAWCVLNLLRERA